jgi:hypothetical protein
MSLALAAPIMLAPTGSATAGDDSGGIDWSKLVVGQDQLAEMIAFEREAPDVCPASADDDALRIYVFDTSMVGDNPTEDEIDAKQSYLKRLLAEMGKTKWCAIYREQVRAAKSILDTARQAHDEEEGK